MIQQRKCDDGLPRSGGVGCDGGGDGHTEHDQRRRAVADQHRGLVAEELLGGDSAVDDSD